jgi:hypothetical protein
MKLRKINQKKIDHIIITKMESVEFYHYLLAAFGWVAYIVGRLWLKRKQYDINDDGLDVSEVKLYLKRNWIGFAFNAILLVVLTPYIPDIWQLFIVDPQGS